MPEIRKNVVTGELVIVAPERAARPTDHPGGAPEVPSFAKSCPFCPGNESLTPAATYTAPAGEHWAVRAVPNKYSALDPNGPPWSEREGLEPRGAASGPHEVIIEGQHHGARFWQMTSHGRRAVVEAWRQRTRDFYDRPSVEHVVLFKNQGPAAGSSLTHPHSQIVGLPELPGRFEHRKMIMARHERATGRCLLCDVIERERSEGIRVVAESERFLAFVPFAAFSPLHVWICPKAHQPSVASLDAEALEGLEALLTPVLRALDRLGERPDFNLVFLGAHPDAPRDAGFHWYIAVVGRTTKSAGFELGTGMYINPSSPEAQAKRLRADYDSAT